MGQSIVSQVLDRRLWELMRPYIKRIVAAFLFSLLASGASGAIAWLVKPVVDSIFVEKKYEMLSWLPIVIIGLYFFRGFFQMIYSYLMKSAGIKLVMDTRVKLYNQMIFLPVSALSKESSGKIISRILSDVAVLRSLVSDIFLTVLKEIPTVVVLLGIALYRRMDVTILALVVLPAIILCARRFGKIVKKKRVQAQQSMALITHRVSEAALGAKVIKIFLNETGFINRFRRESGAYYRQEVKIVRVRELSKLIVDLSNGIGVGLVIWYGGSLVVKGIITSGDLFSTLGAVVMIFSPVKKLGNSYTVFQEIRAAVERLSWFDQMDIEKSGTIVLEDFRNEIRFDKVSHRYHPTGDLVLKDIDLTIKKGEIVAIVGPSGAGKTTLIDLLPRFYDSDRGKVLIDNHDIKEVQLSDLRGMIGLVSQDIMLFNDTIRENIAFGSPDASDKEIEEAACLAFAHDFIAELPDKYNTILGERGLNLSGGQRQRIAIARAIFKNPPILILDEATSALDAVSEGLVQKALDRLMKERTTIVIAHRLSTIRNADRIVVMDHGKIVSQGSHNDLLNESEVYQKLYLSYTNIREEKE